MVALAGIIIHLIHLTFRNVPRIDPANTLAARMHMQHYLGGLISIHSEKNLEHFNNKLHGRVVVIQQHHPIERRLFDLWGSRFDRQPIIMPWVVFFAHILILRGQCQSANDILYRMTKPQNIIVGLSGGVDSAVAAHLLIEQGYRVEGLFMKNWEDDDTSTSCTAETDHQDARQVADTLGIPLHHANFAANYREEVFAHCLQEFRAGRTPNPDILCNQRIKFHAFLQHATRLGADAVATGHYARVGRGPSGYTLERAADQRKDQTYFLYTLGQSQLARAVFPLADLMKTEVRQMADQAGFANHAKPDSTGICFIGPRDFRTFLNRYIEFSPGPMVTLEGEVIGKHVGLPFYTIGQRRGLDLGGRSGHPAAPWYVVDKDLEQNRLIVTQGHDHPALLSQWLTAIDMQWVDGQGPTSRLRCSARLRHGQVDAPALLELDTAGRWRVHFDQPQRAVAPGQSVVIYHGQQCLGGGIIDTRDSLIKEPPRAIR